MLTLDVPPPFPGRILLLADVAQPVRAEDS